MDLGLFISLVLDNYQYKYIAKDYNVITEYRFI
jgi:hypothetical protein